MSAFIAEAAPDLLIGKTLEHRYRVVRKLGEGGMGAVYEGEHLVIKKRVAIKVLHPQYASSPEVVARFHQEALAATAIGHEHIVEVNDMGRTPDGAIFMVLEYLDGHDFAHLLEREPRVPLSRVVHIVSQICEGVQAAHDKGIVHRDLKPENVFLVRRGSDPDFVKVLDFGISKFADSESGGRSATKTGSILGTAYYMSPEQAQGKKGVDHRTDVWAIGVILYRALAGRYPFDDESYPMLVLKIVTESPPTLSSLRPDLPAPLASLVEQCLARDVAARVSSCRELRARLAAFASFEEASATTGREEVVTSPATSAEAPPSVVALSSAMPSPATIAASGIRPKARISTVLAAAGVGALVVASGAWLWQSQHSASTPDELERSDPSPREHAPEPVLDAESAAPTELIEFIVSPSGAVVLIDGRPLTGEEDETLTREVDPNDVTVHELRVEARGFRSRVEDIRLSYHQRIVVDLDPGTGLDDRRDSAPEPPPDATRHGHATRTDPHAAPPTGPSHVGPPSAHGSVIGGEHEDTSAVGRTTEAPELEPAHAEPVVPPTSRAPTVEGIVTPPSRAPLKRLTIP